MRKIVHPRGRHNLRPGIGLAVVAALALVAGCGQGNDAPADTGGAPSGSGCAAVLDTTAWHQFLSMADRMAGGEEVPAAERQAWAASPAVEGWRRSLAPNVPRVRNVANWLEGAWWEELGHTRDPKLNADRVSLGRSYRYSREYALEISRLLARFAAERQACTVLATAERWLPAGALPDTVRFVFLPAKPELRITDGTLYIDTGVLIAGGVEQTVRQLAALLFRSLGAPPGPNPIEAEGAEAVAASFRVMMNEGVAAHIEGTTRILFGADHPTLRRIHIVPEEFFRKAQDTVALCNTTLPDLLADRTQLIGRGNGFARRLAASNAFTGTGIAMAEVIVARRGEDELRRVCRSPAAFLAAYQDAALANPAPAPIPGTQGVPLAETVPPLAPDVFAGLQDLLGRFESGTAGAR